MTVAFSIGSVPINGRVILAPMDGLSDQPFRWLCRRMGSAVTISEFINVLDVPNKLKDFSRRTCFSEYERPFGYQLYGAEIDKIVSAALSLTKKAPDFIDLNLGCSVRRISGRGAGAGLLKDPKKIKTLISSLVGILNIPLTIKMRLGWDSKSNNYLEVARIAEGEGAALISVHARSRDQQWNVRAEWEPIRVIKKAISIPVVGNGDVKTIDDIQAMLEQTECDGIMIGRAAIGNPWLFSNIRKRDLSADIILETILLHWQLMQAFYGANKARVLFKKHLKAYLSCPQFVQLNIQAIIKSENPIRKVVVL